MVLGRNRRNFLQSKEIEYDPIITGLADGIWDIIKSTGQWADTLLYDVLSLGLSPIIFRPLADPLLKGEEVSTTDTGAYLKHIMEQFLEKRAPGEYRSGVALLPIIFLVILAIPSFIGAVGTPITDKLVGQPLRKAFRPRILETSETLTAWQRGYIDLEARNERLSRAGYSDTDIEALEKLLWYIPSATDIIRFAVREVYSPEIARAFGQYEGLDKVKTEAKDDILKAGLPEETFEKFWVSHWILPSIMQGFEMLHRNVISSDDLDRLFVALDIMPFWRDKLKQISYVPYTRVDVRRMHKLGVLDESGVKRAYLDLGYDDDKATKMTEFTIEYNRTPVPEDTTLEDNEIEKEKLLTKSDILKRYRLGWITKEQTKSYLIELGYTGEAADYYISREDYILESDITDTIIEYLHNAYILGVKTKAEVETKFGTLNIPVRHQEILFRMWDTELEYRIERPSKAELFRFYKKGIIDQATLEKELKLRGYSDVVINWYLQDLASATT